MLPDSIAGEGKAGWGRLVLVIGAAFAVSVALLALPGHARSTSYEYDPSFGKPGSRGVAVPVQDGSIADLLPLPGGKILFAGRQSAKAAGKDGARFLVGRLNADGSRDSSFGDDGQARVPAFANDGFAASVIKAPGGGFFVAGNVGDARDSTSHPAVFRIHGDGSLDRSFRPYRGSTPKLGPHSFTRLSIDSKGRVVAIGSLLQMLDRKKSVLVMRFRPQGGLDGSFGLAGHLVISTHRKGRNYGTKVIPLSGGRLLINGNLGRSPFVARTLDSGALDSKFGGGDGFISLPVGPALKCERTHPCTNVDMVRLSNGRIRVLTDFEPYEFTWRPYIVGLTASGRIDREFGDKGRLAMAHWGADPKGAVELLARKDGSMIVIGNKDGLSFQAIAQRVTSTGHFDSGFGKNGTLGIAGESAHGGTLLPNGDLLTLSEKWGRSLIQKFRR